MAPLHVIIIGAGIGGLTFAQALRKQGISFEVFERDESEKSRKQGWSIGIHSILDDLRNSLPDDMPPVEETDHLQPLNLPAQLLYYSATLPGRNGVQGDNEHPILRANRRKLRKWLSTNLDIQYSKQAYKIEETESRVTVYFKDGTHATGDLLVGADGINSMVRGHLLGPHLTPRAFPLATVTGEITISGDAFKRQLENAHSCWIADVMTENGKNSRIFVGLDSVKIEEKAADYYWTISWFDETATRPPHWTHKATAEELYETACMAMKNLPESLKEIVDLSGPQSIVKNQITYRDLEITSIPSGRITLLGDAAHPMAPSRGEGGVNAIKDGLCLAHSLAALVIAKDLLKVRGVVQAVDEYHKEMIPRGVEAVRRSRDAFDGDESDELYFWGLPCRPLADNKIDFL